jgi:hypothetical protein
MSTLDWRNQSKDAAVWKLFQISPPNFASKFTTFSGLIGGALYHHHTQKLAIQQTS